MTNRQIFYDDVTPKARRSDIEITNHSIFTLEIDQTLPLFLLAFMMFLHMICYETYSWISSCIKTDNMNMYLRNYVGLLNYHDSLNYHDLNILKIEEEDNRKRLGYSKMNNYSFEKLKKSHIKRKATNKNLLKKDNKKLEDMTILNEPCYDILMNARYRDLFQYVPVIYRDPDQPDKQEYIDSEFVRKCVDLAYIPDSDIIDMRERNID